MRFSELLDEDPVYDPNEMKRTVKTDGFFYSVDTLQREYIFIADLTIGDHINCVFIEDQFTRAVIGEYGTRKPDDKEGMYIDCELTFKQSVDLGPNSDLTPSDKTLQVDLVEVHENGGGRSVSRARGLGYHLYSALVMAGFTIISDTLQYRGGKALWVKMAQLSKGDGFSVYILQNGKFIEENGQPLAYDGANISDDVIWSEDEANKHVLLVARKN